MLSNIFMNAGFCSDAYDILYFVGTVFFIFKIVVPILLIVWGSIDLGKAVVAQKEDEIKNATQIFVKRAISGIVIFFIPTIVGLVFGLIGDFQDGTEMKEEYDICASCIRNPYSDGCYQK